MLFLGRQTLRHTGIDITLTQLRVAALTGISARHACLRGYFLLVSIAALLTVALVCQAKISFSSHRTRGGPLPLRDRRAIDRRLPR
jgi:hypothetical protein